MFETGSHVGELIKSRSFSFKKSPVHLFHLHPTLFNTLLSLSAPATSRPFTHGQYFCKLHFVVLPPWHNQDPSGLTDVRTD